MISYKGWTFQQVLGSIAAQGQFREYRQVAAFIPCQTGPMFNPATVIIKITDERIYLNQCYFHGILTVVLLFSTQLIVWVKKMTVSQHPIFLNCIGRLPVFMGLFPVENYQ
jgi:hypothetical protein